MRMYLKILTLTTLLYHVAFSQQLDTNYEPAECGHLNEKYFENFNGTTAFDEYPWIGRMYYQASQSHHDVSYRCQAILISRRHLLCPASCVILRNKARYEAHAIILGYDNRCFHLRTCPTPVPNYYEIDQIAVHPNVTLSLEERAGGDDIAVITLKKDVTFGADVQPICLPAPAETNFDITQEYHQFGGYAGRYVTPKLKAVANVTHHVFENYVSVLAETSTLLLRGGSLMGVRSGKPRRYYLAGISVGGLLVPEYDPAMRYLVLQVAPYLEWIKNNL